MHGGLTAALLGQWGKEAAKMSEVTDSLVSMTTKSIGHIMTVLVPP